MKSQKGVTLTSLIIYITVVLIVVGILAVITANFQGNIREIYAEGTNNVEIDKFNVYFLKEVKKQGNAISTILDNEILFSTGNKYAFNENEKSIYLNNNIKIAEHIEKCIFSNSIVNQKTIITITIKSVNGEEKTIDYVLSDVTILDTPEEESNYINYVPEDWDLSKLNKETPVVVETFDNNVYVAPIPKGFEISTEPGENTISGGLVITDGENEFVFIPYISEYIEDELINLTDTDPSTGYAWDSQEQLDFYYGTDENGDSFYDYTYFDYATDKINIEKSINKYHGFYVGRYETTIDENGTIGSMPHTTVLTSGAKVEQTNNQMCRWYGLYKLQKDMYAEDEIVFSTMITSKQWRSIMNFTGYGETSRSVDTYANTPDLSGSSYKDTTDTYDVSKNIYDLAGNTYDWTLTGEGGCRFRYGRKL